jgi:hypothetical protein
MTLALYKQLQRDGMKLNAERARSSKQTMLIRGCRHPERGTESSVPPPQRDKLKKKNKKLADQNLAYVA